MESEPLTFDSIAESILDDLGKKSNLHGIFVIGFLCATLVSILFTPLIIYFNGRYTHFILYLCYASIIYHLYYKKDYYKIIYFVLSVIFLIVSYGMYIQEIKGGSSNKHKSSSIKKKKKKSFK